MLKYIFIFVLLIGSIHAFKSSYGAQKCRRISISHGRTKTRLSGRLQMYTCNSDYVMFGKRMTFCHEGQWEDPPPVCAAPSPNCVVPTVSNVANVDDSNSHLYLTYFCEPGYRIERHSSIYCDGNKWNDTAPRCISDITPEPLSCDFEQDLCGWQQDEYHDFDWTRYHYKTPSSFLSTGPSYDHTLGKGKDGYYMYIESTSKPINSIARLISPVYEAKYADGGCFSFYYHMYGESTGGLKIYLKYEGEAMNNIWNEWGNQGDKWLHAVVKLQPPMNASFQIIIEGVRGRSFTSDIAIDDVALLLGENCTDSKLPETTTASSTAAIIYDTCADRCLADTPSYHQLYCDCDPYCFLRGSCCADYFYVCNLADSKTTGDENDDTPSTTTVTTTTRTTQTTPQTTEVTKTTTVKPTTITTTTQKPTTTKKAEVTKTVNVTIATTTTTKSYIKVTNSTPGTTTSTTIKVTNATKVTKVTTAIPTTIPTVRTTEKVPPIINRKSIGNDVKTPNKNIIAIIASVIGGVIALAIVVYLVLTARSHRGVAIVASFRSRVAQDQEVTFLQDDE